ncbi:MAG: TIGR03668 family PPOX class F420-dependent oxidoreductase [Streptosporangiaceae bacterium]
MRISAEEARQRFGRVRSARLATVSADGEPHLVPVTFAMDGDVLYTAVDAKPKSTRQLRRLSNIRANPRVCLLADHYADDWSALWWVRADGTAAIVSDAREMAAPLGLLAARYRQYEADPPEGPVIAIQLSRWSGWSAV